MRSRMGGLLGALIGFQAWLMGLTWLCWAAGNLSVLLHFVAMGFVVNLFMVGILWVTVELAVRAFCDGGMWKCIWWGEVAGFLGVQALLLNHWVAPILESSPQMMEILAQRNITYRTPNWVPLVSICVGLMLIAISLLHLVKKEHTVNRKA